MLKVLGIMFAEARGQKRLEMLQNIWNKKLKNY